MRQQQGLRCDLDGLPHHLLGRMCDVANKAEPVARADHLGAEFSQPMMGDGAGLEISDGVGRVVHELHVPDAPSKRTWAQWS